jgi:DNA primase
MSYDIEDVKARADLAREVADRVGAGKWRQTTVTYPCPNPTHSDNHPSFTVDTVRGRFRCWSQCARGGDVIDLVEWLDGVTTADAITYLGDKYGALQSNGKPSGNKAKTHTPKTVKTSPPKLVTEVPDECRPLAHEKAAPILSRFMDSRGWLPEVLDIVDLSVVVDKYGATRVRFPFPRFGEVLLWQDRATNPATEMRYLTPTGATLYPFGLDCLARYDTDDSDWPDCPIVGGAPAVWIVEGPADAVTLLNLWPDLSVLGLAGAGSWNDNYARALSRVPVVIVADNDPAGHKLRATLSQSLDGLAAAVIHVHVPEQYNDLGDWYLGDGWERFADNLIDSTEAAMVAVILGTEGVAS